MLRTVGLIMLVVGVVLLVISLILIFTLKIPELLDELTGRKAKRQIKRLKELSQGTGSLDGMATDDFYITMPSGTLNSVEVNVVENEEIKDEDDLETNYIDESNLETNYMDEDNETEFMDEVGEDASTNYIDAENSILTEKHFIRIIEEQSSL